MTQAEKSSGIDLGLAVISAITPPGHQWTLQDIAEVCGCHKNNIYLIERKALQKLRRRFLLMGQTDGRLNELCEALHTL